jgi:hypothetical protein
MRVTEHAPSSPFGCTVQWGREKGTGPLYDMRTHVCNDIDNHEGPHVCRCGAALSTEDPESPTLETEDDLHPYPEKP